VFFLGGGRVKDPAVAQSITNITANSTEGAIRLWDQKEEMALNVALGTVWQAMICAGGLLCVP